MNFVNQYQFATFCTSNHISQMSTVFSFEFMSYTEYIFASLDAFFSFKLEFSIKSQYSCLDNDLLEEK